MSNRMLTLTMVYAGRQMAIAEAFALRGNMALAIAFLDGRTKALSRNAGVVER